MSVRYILRGLQSYVCFCSLYTLREHASPPRENLLTLHFLFLCHPDCQSTNTRVPCFCVAEKPVQACFCVAEKSTETVVMWSARNMPTHPSNGARKYFQVHINKGRQEEAFAEMGPGGFEARLFAFAAFSVEAQHCIDIFPIQWGPITLVFKCPQCVVELECAHDGLWVAQGT